MTEQSRQMWAGLGGSLTATGNATLKNSQLELMILRSPMWVSGPMCVIIVE